MTPFYDAHETPKFPIAAMLRESRRRDLEPCAICGGDRLRSTFKADPCHAPLGGGLAIPKPITVCESCRGNGDHPVGNRASGDPAQEFECCGACGGTGDGDYPRGA